MAAVPSGSILSSSLSLEPFPYEEPRPSLHKIDNPRVSTLEALCNPIYNIPDAVTNPTHGVDEGRVCRTITNEGATYDYEDLSEVESKSQSTYDEEPGTKPNCITNNKSTVSGPSVGSDHERERNSIKNVSSKYYV